MEHPAESTGRDSGKQSKSGSRSEQTYRRLRELLMDGAIPPTERLAEEALAARFEVSRTPVREALTRLLVDGLVERRDGGLYLHVPSFDSLAELYELRITLELRGIQRIMESRELSHDHQVLSDELAKWYDYRVTPPAPDAGFVGRDEGFHVSLLRASGSRALVEALNTVNQRIRPVRMYDYLTEDRLQATIDEHLQIGEFVADDDLTAALAALRTHVEESRDVVMERASRAMPMMRIAGSGW
jgi:DNA-binding GntR family transcriptional regulator